MTMLCVQGSPIGDGLHVHVFVTVWIVLGMAPSLYWKNPFLFCVPSFVCFYMHSYIDQS